MLVTIDAGNSAIKLALWQGDRLVASHRCEHASDLSAGLPAEFHAAAGSRVVIASVLPEQVGYELAAACRQAGWVDISFLSASKSFRGVSNAYADPAHHGVDRWAALLGAHELYPGRSVCVIDAGTALTVDLMDATGQHLGGRIMPGLELMRESLLRADGIGSVGDATPVFASNTGQAVASGTLRLLVAGVAQVIEDAAEVLGEDMLVIMTGGDAERLAGQLPPGIELQVEPMLVMQGLRVSAEEA